MLFVFEKYHGNFSPFNSVEGKAGSSFIAMLFHEINYSFRGVFSIISLAVY